MSQDYWLLGFNFNVAEWFEGDRYETLANLPLAPPWPRRVRGFGRREAGRPVHDPRADSRSEAAPGVRRVKP